MLISVSPLPLHPLVFWLHLSLHFSSYPPDINAVKHYWRNTVILGEEGGIKHAVCKPISEAESRKSEHRQNSLSVSGVLTGTTQVNIWKTKLLSAQHRKEAARSRQKWVWGPTEACVCMLKRARKSPQKSLSTGLLYRPQRPRTWLSDLFCANCDISDSYQELSICFGSISSPSYVGGRNFRFTPT